MVILCIQWNLWAEISTVVTGIVALGSAGFAIYQFCKQTKANKEATRSRILADYNRFYASNSSIKIVIKSILDGNFQQLHTYDIEIFLRFYEEIYLLIHSENRMKAEIAKYMFSHYAIAAWDEEQLWTKLIDESHPTIDSVKTAEEWVLYKKFVEEMKTINSKTIKI